MGVLLSVEQSPRPWRDGCDGDGATSVGKGLRYSENEYQKFGNVLRCICGSRGGCSSLGR
jgi:hypothetical protein